MRIAVRGRAASPPLPLVALIVLFRCPAFMTSQRRPVISRSRLRASFSSTSMRRMSSFFSAACRSVSVSKYDESRLYFALCAFSASRSCSMVATSPRDALPTLLCSPCSRKITLLAGDPPKLRFALLWPKLSKSGVDGVDDSPFTVLSVTVDDARLESVFARDLLNTARCTCPTVICDANVGVVGSADIGWPLPALGKLSAGPDGVTKAECGGDGSGSAGGPALGARLNVVSNGGGVRPPLEWKDAVAGMRLRGGGEPGGGERVTVCCGPELTGGRVFGSGALRDEGSSRPAARSSALPTPTRPLGAAVATVSVSRVLDELPALERLDGCSSPHGSDR